jgi:hypothetical protein
MRNFPNYYRGADVFVNQARERYQRERRDFEYNGGAYGGMVQRQKEEEARTIAQRRKEQEQEQEQEEDALRAIGCKLTDLSDQELFLPRPDR